MHLGQVPSERLVQNDERRQEHGERDDERLIRPPHERQCTKAVHVEGHARRGHPSQSRDRWSRNTCWRKELAQSDNPSLPISAGPPQKLQTKRETLVLQPLLNLLE